MTKHLYKIALYVIMVLPFGEIFSSCADNWDEHYSETGKSNETLWQVINNNSELASFAQLLQNEKYDQLLNTSQRYTVWIPTTEVNTMLPSGNQMSEDEILTQVIKNHIARSVFSASTITNDSVIVLNGKVMPFITTNGKTVFNGVTVNRQNIACSNGILHLLSAQAPYNHNVWTYLRQDTDISCLTNYLYSFNEKVFDAEASTVGGVSNGMKYYSDSVFTVTNTLWQTIGYLNNEKQRFVMLAPNNIAWKKNIIALKKFFSYPPTEADTSLADKYAKKILISNLVVQGSNGSRIADSLKEVDHVTSWNRHHVSSMIPCSNGVVLKSDSADIDPYQILATTTTIEAEQESKYLIQKSNCSDDDGAVVVSAANTGISGNSFMVYSPSSVVLKPSVTFGLKDMLSCRYDVGVVFVPINMTKNGLASNIDQKKVRVNIELRDLNSSDIKQFNDVEYNGTTVDTIWVVKGYQPAYCDYYPNKATAEDSRITLKITNDATRRETDTYSRTMYLDCIVLKPSQNE